MLERWVAPLLMRLLGDYVKENCFDPGRVHLDVWSGYVVLEKLELRTDAFDKLNLPIALRRGYIGRLELAIPWGNPGTKPTVIKVDQIYMVLETIYEWDSLRSDKRKQYAMKRKLETVEAARQRARLRANQREILRRQRNEDRQLKLQQSRIHDNNHMHSTSTNTTTTSSSVVGNDSVDKNKDTTPGDEDTNDIEDNNENDLFAELSDLDSSSDHSYLPSSSPFSPSKPYPSSQLVAPDAGTKSNNSSGVQAFLDSLLRKVIDNLQIHIRGIHLRWIDRVSDPLFPFAVGMCAVALHIQSISHHQADNSISSHHNAQVTTTTTGKSISKRSATHTKNYPLEKDSPTTTSNSQRTSTTNTNGNNNPPVLSSSSTTVIVGNQSPPAVVRKLVDIVHLSAYIQHQYSKDTTKNRRNSIAPSSSSTLTSSTSSFIPSHLNGTDIDICDTSSFVNAMETIIPRRFDTKPADLEIYFGKPVSVASRNHQHHRTTHNTNTLSPSSPAPHDTTFDDNRSVTPSVLTEAMASEAGLRSVNQYSLTSSGQRLNSARSLHDPSVLPRIRASSAFGPVTSASPIPSNRSFSSSSSSSNLNPQSSPTVSPSATVFGTYPVYHHPTLRDVPSVQALPYHPFAKDFILLPANGQIQLSLAKVSNDLRTPQHDIAIHIGALAFQIQSGQYRCAVAIATGFAAYYTRMKYEHLRPSQRLITNNSNATGSIMGTSLSLMTSSSTVIRTNNPTRSFTNDATVTRSTTSSKASSNETSQRSTPFPSVLPDSSSVVLSSTATSSSIPSSTPLLRAITSSSTRTHGLPSTMDPVRSRIARNWWRFAVIATLQNERNRRNYWRWQDITDHRVIRLTYIWLYKRSLEGTLPSRPWSPKRIRSLEKLQSSRRSLFLEEEEQQHRDEEHHWNQQHDYTDTVKNDHADSVSTNEPETMTMKDTNDRPPVATPVRNRTKSTKTITTTTKPVCFLDTISDASIIKEIVGLSLFRTSLKKWAKKYKRTFTTVITLSEYIDDINETMTTLPSNVDGGGNESVAVPSESTNDENNLKERLQEYTALLEQSWEELDELLLQTQGSSASLPASAFVRKNRSHLSLSAHYLNRIGVYTQLNEHEIVLLGILEDRLSSSDLFLFRTLADHEIIAEKNTRTRYLNEGLIPSVHPTPSDSNDGNRSPTHSVVTVDSIADLPYSRKDRQRSSTRRTKHAGKMRRINIPHADDEDGKSVLTDIEGVEADDASVFSHDTDQVSSVSSDTSWDSDEGSDTTSIADNRRPLRSEQRTKKKRTEENANPMDTDSIRSKDDNEKGQPEPTGSDIDDDNATNDYNDTITVPTSTNRDSGGTNGSSGGGTGLLGWLGLGWIWNSNGTANDTPTNGTVSATDPLTNDSSSSSSLRMTEAQRRELYSIIEYDPETALRPYPPSYNRTLIHLHIDACTLTLVEDYPSLVSDRTVNNVPLPTVSSTLRPLYHVYFEHLDISTTARSTSHRLQCSLQDLAVYDLSRTSAAIFTRIIGKRESLLINRSETTVDKDMKPLRRETSIETSMDRTTTGPKSVVSKRSNKDTSRITNNKPSNDYTYSGDEEGEQDKREDNDVEEDDDDDKSSSRLSEIHGGTNTDEKKERSGKGTSALLYFVFETFPQTPASYSSDTNDEDDARTKAKVSTSIKRVVSGTNLCKNGKSSLPSRTVPSVRSRSRPILPSTTPSVRSSNTKRTSNNVLLTENMHQPYSSTNHYRSPWTNGADAAIVIRLQPLEVTWNQVALSSLREFFANPVKSLQELPGGNALTNAAVHQLQDIRKRTVAALEKAYRQGRIAIAVDARIASPVLILPMKVTQPRSVILVVDSGLLRIRSVKLQNKRSIGVAMAAVEKSNANGASSSDTITGDTTALPTKVPTSDDPSLPFLPALPNQTWSDNLFDTYVFQITSAQALLCKADTPWRTELDRDLRGLSIIKKFSVRIETKVSIVPDDVTVPRVWLISELPALHLRLSHIQSMLLKDILTLYLDSRKSSEKSRKDTDGSKAEKEKKSNNVGVKPVLYTNPLPVPSSSSSSSASSSSSSSWIPSSTFESLRSFRDVMNLSTLGNSNNNTTNNNNPKIGIDLLSPAKLLNRKSFHYPVSGVMNGDEVSSDDYVQFRHPDNNSHLTIFPDTHSIIDTVNSLHRTNDNNLSVSSLSDQSFHHPHIGITDNGMLIYNHHPLYANSMYEKQKKLRTSTIYHPLHNMSTSKGFGYGTHTTGKFYASRLPSRMNSPPPLALGEPVSTSDVPNNSSTMTNSHNIRSPVLLFTPTQGIASNQRATNHRSTGLFSDKSFVTARTYDGDIPLSEGMNTTKDDAMNNSTNKSDTEFVSPVHNFHGFDSGTEVREVSPERNETSNERSHSFSETPERNSAKYRSTTIPSSASSSSASSASHHRSPLSPAGIGGPLPPRTPSHLPSLSSPFLLSHHAKAQTAVLPPYDFPVSSLTFHATFLLASFTLELAHGEQDPLYLRWSPVWNPLALSTDSNDINGNPSASSSSVLRHVSSKYGEKDLITISSVGIRPVFIGGNGNRLTSIFDIRAFHIYDNMQPYGPFFGNLVSSLPRSHTSSHSRSTVVRPTEPFTSPDHSFIPLQSPPDAIYTEKDTIMNDETHEDMTDGRLLRIIVRRRIVNPSFVSPLPDKNVNTHTLPGEAYPETNVDFAFSSIALSLNEATIVAVLRTFVRDERTDNSTTSIPSTSGGSTTMENGPLLSSSDTLENTDMNPSFPSTPLLSSLFTRISASLPSSTVSVLTDSFSFKGISRVNFRLASFELALGVNGKHLAVAALTDSQISVRYASLLHKQLVGCSITLSNGSDGSAPIAKHNYLVSEIKTTSSTQIRGKLGNLRILDYWTIHHSSADTHASTVPNHPLTNSNMTALHGSHRSNYTFWKPGDASNYHNSFPSVLTVPPAVPSTNHTYTPLSGTNPLALPKPREIFGLQQHPHHDHLADTNTLRTTPLNDSLVQFEILLAPVYQSASSVVRTEGYDKRLHPTLTTGDSNDYGLSLSHGIPQGYVVTVKDVLNCKEHYSTAASPTVSIPRAQFIFVRTRSVQCILDSSFFAAFPSYYTTSPLILYSRGGPRTKPVSTMVDSVPLPVSSTVAFSSGNLLNHVKEALRQRIPPSLQSLTIGRYHIELERPVLIVPRRWCDEDAASGDKEENRTFSVSYRPSFRSVVPGPLFTNEKDTLLHLPRLREYMVLDLGQISVTNTFNSSNSLVANTTNSVPNIPVKGVLELPSWNEKVQINVTSLHAQLTCNPYDLHVTKITTDDRNSSTETDEQPSSSPPVKDTPLQPTERLNDSSSNDISLPMPLHFSKKIIRDVDIRIDTTRPAPFTPELHLSTSVSSRVASALRKNDLTELPFVVSELTTNIQIAPIEMDLADVYLPLLRAIWYENGRRLQRIFFGGGSGNSSGGDNTKNTVPNDATCIPTVQTINRRIRRSKIHLNVTGLWLNLYRTKKGSTVKIMDTTDDGTNISDESFLPTTLPPGPTVVPSVPIELTELINVHVEHAQMATSEIQDDPRYTYSRQAVFKTNRTLLGEPIGWKSASIILGPLTVCDTRTDRKNVYAYVMMPRDTTVSSSVATTTMNVLPSLPSSSTNNGPALIQSSIPSTGNAFPRVPSSPFLRFHYIRDHHPISPSSSSGDRNETVPANVPEQLCVLRIDAPRVLIMPELLGSILSWYNQVRTLIDTDNLVRRPYQPGTLQDYGTFILPVDKFIDTDLPETKEMNPDETSIPTEAETTGTDMNDGTIASAIPLPTVSLEKETKRTNPSPQVYENEKIMDPTPSTNDKLSIIIDFRNPEFWLFEDPTNPSSTVIVIQGSSIRGTVKLQRASIDQSYDYIVLRTLETMAKELVQYPSSTVAAASVPLDVPGLRPDTPTKGKYIPRSFELTLLRIEVLMQRPVVHKTRRGSITPMIGSTLDTPLNDDRYPYKGISRSSSQNYLSTIDHTRASSSRASTPFRSIRSRSGSAGIHIVNRTVDNTATVNTTTVLSPRRMVRDISTDQLGQLSPLSRRTMYPMVDTNVSIDKTIDDNSTATDSAPTSPFPARVNLPSLHTTRVDPPQPEPSVPHALNRSRLPPRTWSSISLAMYGTQSEQGEESPSLASTNLPNASPTIEVVPSFASNPRNQSSLFDHNTINENWIQHLSSWSQHRIVLVLPFSMKVSGETYSLVPVPLALNANDIYQRRQAILNSKPSTNTGIRGVVLSSLAHLIDTYFTKQTPAVASIGTGSVQSNDKNNDGNSGTVVPSENMNVTTLPAPSLPPETNVTVSVPDLDTTLPESVSMMNEFDSVTESTLDTQRTMDTGTVFDTDEIPLPPSVPGSKGSFVSVLSSLVDLTETALLEDIQKYNKEAANYTSSLISNMVVKLPPGLYDNLLTNINTLTSSKLSVVPATDVLPVVTDIVRTPLPSQILSLPVAHVSIAPITVCMSQDEIQTLSTIVEALRTLPVTIRRNTYPTNGENGTLNESKNTTDTPVRPTMSPSVIDDTTNDKIHDTSNGSSDSTLIFPMVPLPLLLQKSMQFPLLPHPSCYAGKLQCTTLRMVIVARNFMKSSRRSLQPRTVTNRTLYRTGEEDTDTNDHTSFTVPSVVTIDTELHDALKYSASSSSSYAVPPLPRILPDEKYFHTNLTVPLVRIVAEQCDTMVCAAPALTTVQGKAVTSIDTANAYITRWEPLIEPWTMELSISILRSAVTAIAAAAVAGNSNTTIATDLSRAIVNDNIAAANNYIWYPDNLLRSIALTGLAAQRGKTSRWYDFIGGRSKETTNNSGSLRLTMNDGGSSRNGSGSSSQHLDDALENLDPSAYLADADGQLLPIDILLSSNAPLKLNVTTAGLSTLSVLKYMMDSYKDHRLTNDDTITDASGVTTSIVPFYWIRNDTGCALRYTVIPPPAPTVTSNDSHSNTLLPRSKSDDNGGPFAAARNTEYACEPFRTVPIRSSREHFTWPNERYHFTNNGKDNPGSSTMSGLYLSLLMDVSLLNIPYDTHASYLPSFSHGSDTTDTSSSLTINSKDPKELPPPPSYVRSASPPITDTMSHNANDVLPWNLCMLGYENVGSSSSSSSSSLPSSSSSSSLKVCSSVRIEGTAVHLLRFDAILPSFLPSYFAYEMRTSKLGLRYARIRSTLLLTNRLDISYRFEVYLVPKLATARNGSPPLPCLWSITLHPGQAVWVPAPIAVWLHSLYRTNTSSLFALEYRVVLLYPARRIPSPSSSTHNRRPTKEVRELGMTIPIDILVPKNTKITSESKASFPLSATEIENTGYGTDRPLSFATQGTVAWGYEAYRTARTFQLIDPSNGEAVRTEKEVRMSTFTEAPNASMGAVHPVLHSQRYMYPAEDTVTETIETDETVDDVSVEADSVWSPFTKDPSLPQHHHHYLACLSIEPHLVIVNRLPVGCDIQLTRLKENDEKVNAAPLSSPTLWKPIVTNHPNLSLPLSLGSEENPTDIRTSMHAITATVPSSGSSIDSSHSTASSFVDHSIDTDDNRAVPDALPSVSERTRHTRFYILSGYEHQIHQPSGTLHDTPSSLPKASFILRLRPNNMRGWSSGICFQYTNTGTNGIPCIQNIVPLHGTFIESVETVLQPFDQQIVRVWVKVQDSLLLNERIGIWINLCKFRISRIHIYAPVWIINRTGVPLLIDRIHKNALSVESNDIETVSSSSSSSTVPLLSQRTATRIAGQGNILEHFVEDIKYHESTFTNKLTHSLRTMGASGLYTTAILGASLHHHPLYSLRPRSTNTTSTVNGIDEEMRDNKSTTKIPKANNHRSIPRYPIASTATKNTSTTNNTKGTQPSLNGLRNLLPYDNIATAYTLPLYVGMEAAACISKNSKVWDVTDVSDHDILSSPFVASSSSSFDRSVQFSSNSTSRDWQFSFRSPGTVPSKGIGINPSSKDTTQSLLQNESFTLYDSHVTTMPKYVFRVSVTHSHGASGGSSISDNLPDAPTNSFVSMYSSSASASSGSTTSHVSNILSRSLSSSLRRSKRSTNSNSSRSSHRSTTKRSLSSSSPVLPTSYIVTVTPAYLLHNATPYTLAVRVTGTNTSGYNTGNVENVTQSSPDTLVQHAIKSGILTTNSTANGSMPHTNDETTITMNSSNNNNHNSINTTLRTSSGFEASQASRRSSIGMVVKSAPLSTMGGSFGPTKGENLSQCIETLQIFQDSSGNQSSSTSTASLSSSNLRIILLQPGARLPLHVPEGIDCLHEGRIVIIDNLDSLSHPSSTPDPYGGNDTAFIPKLWSGSFFITPQPLQSTQKYNEGHISTVTNRNNETVQISETLLRIPNPSSAWNSSANKLVVEEDIDKSTFLRLFKSISHEWDLNGESKQAATEGIGSTLFTITMLESSGPKESSLPIIPTVPVPKAPFILINRTKETLMYQQHNTQMKRTSLVKPKFTSVEEQHQQYRKFLPSYMPSNRQQELLASFLTPPVVETEAEVLTGGNIRPYTYYEPTGPKLVDFFLPSVSVTEPDGTGTKTVTPVSHRIGTIDIERPGIYILHRHSLLDRSLNRIGMRIQSSSSSSASTTTTTNAASSPSPSSNKLFTSYSSPTHESDFVVQIVLHTDGTRLIIIQSQDIPIGIPYYHRTNNYGSSSSSSTSHHHSWQHESWTSHRLLSLCIQDRYSSTNGKSGVASLSSTSNDPTVPTVYRSKGYPSSVSSLLSLAEQFVLSVIHHQFISREEYSSYPAWFASNMYNASHSPLLTMLSMRSRCRVNLSTIRIGCIVSHPKDILNDIQRNNMYAPSRNQSTKITESSFFAVCSGKQLFVATLTNIEFAMTDLANHKSSFVPNFSPKLTGSSSSQIGSKSSLYPSSSVLPTVTGTPSRIIRFAVQDLVIHKALNSHTYRIAIRPLPNTNTSNSGSIGNTGTSLPLTKASSLPSLAGVYIVRPYTFDKSNPSSKALTIDPFTWRHLGIPLTISIRVHINPLQLKLDKQTIELALLYSLYLRAITNQLRTLGNDLGYNNRMINPTVARQRILLHQSVSFDPSLSTRTYEPRVYENCGFNDLTFDTSTGTKAIVPPGITIENRRFLRTQAIRRGRKLGERKYHPRSSTVSSNNTLIDSLSQTPQYSSLSISGVSSYYPGHRIVPSSSPSSVASLLQPYIPSTLPSFTVRHQHLTSFTFDKLKFLVSWQQRSTNHRGEESSASVPLLLSTTEERSIQRTYASLCRFLNNLPEGENIPLRIPGIRINDVLNDKSYAIFFYYLRLGGTSSVPLSSSSSSASSSSSTTTTYTSMLIQPMDPSINHPLLYSSIVLALSRVWELPLLIKYGWNMVLTMAQNRKEKDNEDDKNEY